MTDMSWMPWAVGGVMVLSFLYMKVWPFVRTIIRAFRGPRFKSKSKLSVEQYKKTVYRFIVCLAARRISEHSLVGHQR